MANYDFPLGINPRSVLWNQSPLDFSPQISETYLEAIQALCRTLVRAILMSDVGLDSNHGR
jgi:hypothetical protein